MSRDQSVCFNKIEAPPCMNMTPQRKPQHREGNGDFGLGVLRVSRENRYRLRGAYLVGMGVGEIGSSLALSWSSLQSWLHTGLVVMSSYLIICGFLTI